MNFGSNSFNEDSDNSNIANTNTTVDMWEFCRVSVPYFTPLGGSRPDAAVVACAAVWEVEEKEVAVDVILPPDVLDVSLAMLCAPLIVTSVDDLRGQEAHFHSPTATVRLRTTEANVMILLRSMSANNMPRGGLSVTMSLEESVTEMRDFFLSGWAAVGRVDLGRTSLRRIGGGFLNNYRNLTAVNLPRSLTAVGNGFLAASGSLQHLDMGPTALQTVGHGFAAFCRRLTTVVLPETVTEIGEGFLHMCGRVEVTGGSSAVQAAAAQHNKQK